jgi:hypothetical protein
MIPLATTFRADGFDFEQVDRDGDVATYLKTKQGHESQCFEVVLVQKYKEHTWPNGNTTPAHEAMPSSETWGTKGWTYPEREQAKVRFDALAGLYNTKEPHCRG